MFERLPARVRVYEVGPRDGLQNEAVFVPTEDKVRLIGNLHAAGLRDIEITSFVNPRWIPPLADAEHVAAALRDTPLADCRLTALVPNERGLERALENGVREVAVFMSASETHNQRNINKSIADTWPAFAPVFARCAAEGVRVRGYVSAVWGCPYEGLTPVAKTVDVVSRLAEIGFEQLSLGDTIGVGTPGQTAEIVAEVSKIVPLGQIALHRHDTRGTALANALVGLSMGISTFDSSIGGLGGCPYAPGAAGNLATEDLVFMLHGMGIETGIEFDKLVGAGELAQELIGRKLSGKCLQAALGEREKQAARARTAASS